MPRAYTSRKQIMDLSERLNCIDEFSSLDDIQRRICIEHVNHPNLDKEGIAKKLGIKVVEVYNLFHTHAWEVINLELAKQGLRELTQLAIAALRQCLMDKRSAVKLQACVNILANAKILEQTSKRTSDNKMVIVWNESKDVQSLNTKPNLRETNENRNTLLPAPETAGDTREPVQV